MVLVAVDNGVEMCYRLMARDTCKSDGPDKHGHQSGSRDVTVSNKWQLSTADVDAAHAFVRCFLGGKGNTDKLLVQGDNFSSFFLWHNSVRKQIKGTDFSFL